MLKENYILLGKASDKEIRLLPNMLNRHGLIAGASGTGKTVTLKVIAESKWVYLHSSRMLRVIYLE